MAVDWAGDVLRMLQDFGEDVTYRQFHGLATNGGYFAIRYFPDRFFPGRYFPHGRGPTAPPDKTIRAIVDRAVKAVDQQYEMAYAPTIEVTVTTDPDTGIPAEELDTGGDRILIADRVGKPPKERSIVRVLEHDPQGYMLLEIQ